jgi:hypothetical protein
MITKRCSCAHGMLSLITTLFMASGCSLTEPTRWIVEPHSLDYVELMYTATPDSTDNQVRVYKLNLLGNGYLSFTETIPSRSSSSSDTFWDQHVRPGWHNALTDNIVIGERAARTFFQRVVDAGFFESGFNRRQSKEKQRLLVYANIGGRKNSVYTEEQDLRDVFFDLLKAFR